jgi:hypothetical protein
MMMIGTGLGEAKLIVVSDTVSTRSPVDNSTRPMSSSILGKQAIRFGMQFFQFFHQHRIHVDKGI